MAQTQVSARLIERIRWLAAPDTDWTAEDGRPTSRWAANQALILLERLSSAGLPFDTEPEATATARGGIELLWKHDHEELDVTLPPEADQPIEVVRARRGEDDTLAEDEREAASVDDVIMLIADTRW